MARARETRLTRVAVSAARGNSPVTVDRLSLDAWLTVAAFVHDALRQAGIDPARVRALHLLPDCGALPPLGSGQPGEEFVTSDGDGLAATFADRIGNIVRSYQDGRVPDFANASLAELLAWSLSRTNHGSGEGTA
jgi:hypothetical protein